MKDSDKLAEVLQLLPALSAAERAMVRKSMSALDAEQEKARHDNAVAELRRIASESGIRLSIRKRRYRRRVASKPKAAA